MDISHQWSLKAKKNRNIYIILKIAMINFQLYNMQGTMQHEGKTTNYQTEINVANLPRGMYILKILTDKQTITKKVVLQ